jgi:accessory colonization factor AcfC
MNKIFVVLGSILLSVIAFTNLSLAQDTLYVYGPGGPAPAMKEAAAIFEKQTDTRIIITAGPTPKWIASAKNNADIIFSGSETMMTDFTVALEGLVDESEVIPMYLRPLSILVRPGNPKNIKGVNDIFVHGIQVLVVNGAGQNGVWEDMAGRKGDIKSVKTLRKNIIGYAKNSSEARQLWIEKPNDK